MENIVAIATIIGAIHIGRALLQFSWFVRNAFSKQDSVQLLQKYQGCWVAITGATDGIGKATAHELANRGLNVLLISRNEQRLQDVASELRQKYNVRVEWLQVDFSERADLSRIESTFRALEGGLALLVNNVGVSYERPMLFHELGDELVHAMTTVNVIAMVDLTRIALKIFLQRNFDENSSLHRRGAILNVGSFSGCLANPLLSEYSASKAYMERLTQGLAYEYQSMGVDFQVSTPSYIVSKLSRIRSASFLVPTADNFASLMCNMIGSGVIVSNPYVPHQLLQLILTSFLPERLSARFVRWYHMRIRNRAMERNSAKRQPTTQLNEIKEKQDDEDSMLEEGALMEKRT